jgi:hypothetical protein
MPAGQEIVLEACAGYPVCTSTQNATTIATWSVPTPTRVLLQSWHDFGIYYATDTGGGNYWYFEFPDPRSFNSTNAIANNAPTLGSLYALGAYPNGGQGNYGFDLDFRAIPTNPNGPSGTTGLMSWLAVCTNPNCT